MTNDESPDWLSPGPLTGAELAEYNEELDREDRDARRERSANALGKAIMKLARAAEDLDDTELGEELLDSIRKMLRPRDGRPAGE